MTLKMGPTKPAHVLVVEDEPRLRDLLASVIPEMGFDVSLARSGEEALRTLAQQPHDILLVDLHLPGMDGIELLEKVREQDARIQAIILTAYGSLDAARRAIHLEVADFLQKPCPLNELEQALDRARKRLLSAGQQPAMPEPSPDAPPQTLEALERQQILAALARWSGNRTKAAAELGISRRTLQYRLAEYGYTDRTGAS